jgi:SAM-dependent methyltransferase
MSKPSGYVRRCLARMELAQGARVLDMPVGFGRNTMLLAEAGYSVVGVDVDARRIAAVEALKRARSGRGPIECLVADARTPLPIAPATFDLILVVHFMTAGLTSLLRPLLKPGGFLLLESFGGQGGNYLDLPQPGEMRAALAGFEILDYRETLVGPAKSEAVAVRFLARLPGA